MVLSRPESPIEPTKPKLPREAIELYNDFIHGEISRRAFMATPESIRSLELFMAPVARITSLSAAVSVTEPPLLIRLAEVRGYVELSSARASNCLSLRALPR